jgi:hypothetical protein
VIFDTKGSFYTFSNFHTHTDEFGSSIEPRQADPSTVAYDSLDFIEAVLKGNIVYSVSTTPRYM